MYPIKYWVKTAQPNTRKVKYKYGKIRVVYGNWGRKI